MNALLRIVELEKGQILIDGQDIQAVGLAKLRSSIAVIPQDPVLFSGKFQSYLVTLCMCRGCRYLLACSLTRLTQSPKGTVRSNIDPFDEYDDIKLYEVLERVGLYTPISHVTSATRRGGSNIKSGKCRVQSLDDDVTEGGGNFSVGQRQLLVIARALLHGATIVIVDEATASVDAETDAIITECMRREFARSTVLTVAHR